jgi:putative glutamine amidotransferase
MKIALTKGHGSSPVYGNYEKWLRAADDSIEVVDLAYCTSVAQALETVEPCDGIVFTGGADINPDRYGKSGEREYCIVDDARDELEFALFDHVRTLHMPILGICRGMQLINVALGGSLYTDVPTFVRTDIEHRRIEDTDSHHGLIVTPGSLLKKLTNELEGTVNSAHHQAVERLAGDLAKAATSPDGIVEAVEWATPESRQFLFAVEWHPERMDYDSVFSLPIARHFLFEAASYEVLLKK